MKIVMVAQSDIGRVREANEDYCGIFSEDNLAVLCDGMGGHNAGAHASRLAVSTIRYMSTFLDQSTQYEIAKDVKDPYKEVAANLVSAVRLANRHIYNRALKNVKFNGMGTTVSALMLQNNVACICHVGDSRIYCLRGDELLRLTEDHSWVNELLQDNEIKADEVLQFEKKNVITRALGLFPTVKIDLKIESIKKNDLFLLCSDGLTKTISDDEIKQTLLSQENNLDEAVSALINLANKKDGSDNITVSLVKILEVDNIPKPLLPVTITLKTEDSATSLLENKILKREFSKKNAVDKIFNWANGAWGKKYSKVFAAAALLLLMIVFVRYSFTDHKTNPSNEQASEIGNLQPGHQTASSNIHPNSQYQNEITKIDTLPDSKIKKADSLKTAAVQSEKILTRSLNQTSQNRGLIYLVGIENLSRHHKTLLLLNNQLLGKTEDFFESGIRVRPGNYEIAIKDSNRTTLFQHNDIWISAGDIKAIEFQTRKTRQSISNN